jgi:hypothetical protein
MPDVRVKSVLTKVQEHLLRQGLGSPMFPDATVHNIIERIRYYHGTVIENGVEKCVNAAKQIARSCDHARSVTYPIIEKSGPDGSHSTGQDEIVTLKHALNSRDEEIMALKREVTRLKQLLAESEERAI